MSATKVDRTYIVVLLENKEIKTPVCKLINISLMDTIRILCRYYKDTHTQGIVSRHEYHQNNTCSNHRCTCTSTIGRVTINIRTQS